ncbi:MAG TPA: type III secretion protein [Peptococcaceae bacterium]|nr:type III secretion protein [Peptococcaceae bacterium]
MKKEDKALKISPKKAAALAYDRIGAPRVVTKGKGFIAQKIIDYAEEKGIPVQRNESLVDALMQVELSKEIPPELYQAVAEVLALIYRLDQKKAEEKQKYKHNTDYAR